MRIKAQMLPFFYAKKTQNVQNREKIIWCILNNKYLGHIAY